MGHPSPESPPEIELPYGYVCTVCTPMPTPEENKCCGKHKCVTSDKLFQNICIDREVLTVPIRARCDIRVEEPDYTSNSQGNRNVCPACTVGIVREAYPAL